MVVNSQSGAGGLVVVETSLHTSGSGAGSASMAAGGHAWAEPDLRDVWAYGVHQVPDRSRVEYASEELLARLDGARVEAQPMGADYLYDVNRMIDLAGGDLASKRQAKNRFLRNYQSRVEVYQKGRHFEECCR